jgi:hypothetical protein
MRNNVPHWGPNYERDCVRDLDEGVPQPGGSWSTTEDLKIVMVPRELYYHEVAYVRGLEVENERLLDAKGRMRVDLANAQADNTHLRAALQDLVDAIDTVDLGETRDAIQREISKARAICQLTRSSA